MTEAQKAAKLAADQKAEQLKALLSKVSDADYEAFVEVFREKGDFVQKAKAEAEKRDAEAAEQAAYEQKLQAHRTNTEEAVTTFAEQLAEKTFATAQEVRDFVKEALLDKLERVPVKGKESTGSTRNSKAVQTVREGSGNWLIKEACKNGFTPKQEILDHMVEGGITLTRAKRLYKKAEDGKLPVEVAGDTMHWIGED